jgi:mannose-1-phosphate guanylyltransferase
MNIPGILLAAGKGSRIQSLSGSIPKPLLPVFGVPVARFSLNRLQAIGCQQVFVNACHRANVVAAYFDKMSKPDTIIQISWETGSAIGVGGGIAKIFRENGLNRALVASADVISGIDLGKLVEAHFEDYGQTLPLLTLAVVKHRGITADYSRIILDSSLRRVVGLTSSGPCEWQYSGYCVIERDLLETVAEGSFITFADLLSRAISLRRVGVYIDPSCWVEAGDPAGWFAAHVRLMGWIESGAFNSKLIGDGKNGIRRLALGCWADELACSRLGRDTILNPPVFIVGDGAPLDNCGPFLITYGNHKASRNAVSFYGNELHLTDADIRQAYDS